ncbi:deleted in autism protein 1 homolog [Ceratina calcarata]|uniref:Deleted in autism protein 1 homolog n=1 Tax=Ceratina calcarata TaxID=156304 RepID=A0AAJ7J2R4_9HYME|nr:deleted in autism protein 1 homolog [Ceratina calcarata]
MIISYVCNILNFKKWELLSLVTILLASKYLLRSTFQPDVNQLTELEKCPACFGKSACEHIREVDITPFDFHSTFAYFFGVKNVFFGFLNTKKVVLKKLAQNFELNEFDRKLCENDTFLHICTANKIAKNDRINFHQLLKDEISLQDFKTDNRISRLTLCPTVERLTYLLDRIYHNNRNVDRNTLEINIWTLAVLNPEPLLLQILPAEDNWPVAKYLGACGRIVIEEYVGLPLTAYYNQPWLHRAKIASSLLDAAFKFTYKNTDFAFYLTDVSADNIAVDTNDNAIFVDLENVIIVDRNMNDTERQTPWNSRMQVNTEDQVCPECLAFDSTEICNNDISDHNFYAICKVLLALNPNNNILPGGLLHDIPADVLQKYSNLQYLIEQCVDSQEPFNRIEAGMQLKKLLNMIITEGNE